MIECSGVKPFQFVVKAMKIIINGDESQETFTGNTLGEILDQIQATKVLQGTVIAYLNLDGQGVEFGQDTEPGRYTREKDISEVGVMEVEITSVQAIVLKNLNNVETYLEKLIPGIQKGAELFQREDEVEANKFFINIVDGMDWVSQVLDGVFKTMQMAPETLEFDGKTLAERQILLIDLTKQLLKANENKDWILTADLLEYEIAPFYQEWSQWLPKLKSKVAEPRN